MKLRTFFNLIAVLLFSISIETSVNVLSAEALTLTPPTAQVNKLILEPQKFSGTLEIPASRADIPPHPTNILPLENARSYPVPVKLYDPHIKVVECRAIWAVGAKDLQSGISGVPEYQRNKLSLSPLKMTRECNTVEGRTARFGVYDASGAKDILGVLYAEISLKGSNQKRCVVIDADQPAEIKLNPGETLRIFNNDCLECYANNRGVVQIKYEFEV